MSENAPGPECRPGPEQTSHSRIHGGRRPRTGLLIINGDDWGRDEDTTDRISECFIRQAVSSVSAMVFVKDSGRASSIARERGIDAGLHLNFTTEFSAPNISRRLVENQQRIAAYLLRRRFNQIVFHPGLRRSFEYVLAAQPEEFARLYGRQSQRLVSPTPTHSCPNLLPDGS